jgi:hypothetical protein
MYRNTPMLARLKLLRRRAHAVRPDVGSIAWLFVERLPFVNDACGGTGWIRKSASLR